MNIIDYSTVIFVPSIFYPLGSGVDRIPHLEPIHIRKVNFIICDSEGNKAFQSKSVNETWDGTRAKLKLKSGEYSFSYVVQLKKGLILKKEGKFILDWTS